MNKLLILDKDGTLVRPKSGNIFVQYPEDQELIEGVAEAVSTYATDGWTMAIASNQGGVAAGHKTLEQAIAEMRYAMKLTGINQSYFCPDLEGMECYSVSSFVSYASPMHTRSKYSDLVGKFRKPNSGMIDLAIKRLPPLLYEHEKESLKVLFVGDRREDQGAAQPAVFDFMWVDDWLKS